MDSATTTGGKTIRVRNLPFRYTNEDLEKLFSEIGPLRQAFVVRDTNTKRSKGFGYVSFAIEEDTTSAMSLNGKDVDGRSIVVELATRKNQGSTATKKTASYNVKDSMRLVLVWISSSSEIQDGALEETLRKRLEACGTVEKLSILSTMARYRVVSSLTNVKVAEALMSSAQEAKLFIQKNDRQRMGSLFFVTRRLCSFALTKKAQQNCELIIRNLPFDISKDKIVETCSRFGPLARVRSLKGFCFVRFHFRADAARCLKQLNAKPFGERKKKKKKKTEEEEKEARVVAVDWSLNKEAYMKQNNDNVEEEEEEEEDDDEVSDDEEPKFEISGFEEKNESEEDRPIVPPPPAAPGVTLFVCNIPLSASRGDILRTC